MTDYKKRYYNLVLEDFQNVLEVTCNTFSYFEILKVLQVSFQEKEKAP